MAEGINDTAHAPAVLFADRMHFADTGGKPLIKDVLFCTPAPLVSAAIIHNVVLPF